MTITPLKNQYCGFITVEDLIKDHKQLKALIKQWELIVDDLKNDDDCNSYISERLDALSMQMMSINM